FLPGKWYWEGVITARKFLIAFTSLMFRNTPSYQLAMALLVLFVAYVLQVRAQPYLTHRNTASVVAAHLAKVATDSKHASIQSGIQATAERNLRGRRRAGMEDAAAAAAGKPGAAGSKAGARDDTRRRRQEAQALSHRYTFLLLTDYNAIE